MTYLKQQGLREPFDSLPELSPRQLMALSHVVILEPISVSDLATRLSISLATASQMVTQLAQAGFLTRREDPSDHRRTLVSLSETKGSFAAEVLGELFAPMDRAIANLGEEHFTQLLAYLDQLLTYLHSEESQVEPNPKT